MQLSSTDLAEYAVSLSYDDLDEAVVDQAKKLTLDALACGVNAYPSPPSKVLRSTYAGRTPPEGRSGATVMGADTVAPVEYAALINSTMVRYLDFNDCYTTGSSACHPSDHIPALVSVAEAEGATGRDLIEAIVLAYEMQCRGVDTGAAWNNGFDYVTWGAYSSAVAAGKLMGLSADELVDAIGIAGASSNGLLVARLGEVSHWKGVAQPYATHNAIQACQMARNGLTGPERVFEGDGGFCDAVARGEEVSFEALGGRDGDFRILETSFKAYACGYFTHPSITAVTDVVTDHDIAPEDVEAIDVRTFEHAIQVYASGPEKWATDLNRETADHSLPYNVSVAVLDGEVTPRQYEPDRLTDERVHDMMAKVTAEEDPELTEYRRRNPRHVPAVASVTADGRTYETRVDYPVGHPERPMSLDEVETKARGLLDDLLTEGQIESLIDQCDGLDEAASVDDLVAGVRI